MEKKFLGRALVLTPTQNLTGGKETEELEEAAGQVLSQDQPRIVIELRRIDWINSPGLGALVKIHVSCVNRGGWMRVTGVGKRIKNMLVVTRVIMLFDTFETVDEAVAQPDVGNRKEDGANPSRVFTRGVGESAQEKRPPHVRFQTAAQFEQPIS